MNKDYIDRYLVIDRYLAGDLAESEETEFEERLVWDKALIEEVDLASQLRDGLRVSAAETEADAPATASLPRWAKTFPRLAIAASFAVGALTASLLFNQPAVMVAGNSVPTSVVALDMLRGNAEQEIAIDPDAMIVLMVAAGREHASYSVAISKANDPDVIWAQSGLTPGYTESLAVGINGRLLPSGSYVLSVYTGADDARELISTIPFRAVFPD
jgi:anti-sigma factor RsiW